MPAATAKPEKSPARARRSCDVPPAEKLTGPVSIAIPSELRIVKLDQIDFGPNLRPAQSFSAEAIAGMADSLVRSQQQQPITCWQKSGGRMCLVFGQLRVLGAKQAGLTELRALVLDREPTEDERQRMQAAENLQREAFGLVEEAALVAGRYAHYTKQEGGVDKAAIDRVAQELGRSSKWTHERLRVSRLDPKVLKLIAAGSVTFGAALLLCQVADPRKQERLANDFVRNWQGGSPPLLDDFRTDVQEQRLSLAQVSWDKSAVIEGVKAPACTECQHNSDNDKDLFDIQPKESMQGYRSRAHPDGQVCGKKACYEAKAAWAAKQLEKASTRVAEQLKASGTKAPAAVKKLIGQSDVPAGVDVKALEERVQAKVENKAKPADGDSYQPRKFDQKKYDEQRRIDNKTHQAQDAWRAGIIADIKRACRDGCGRLAGLHILLTSQPIQEAHRYTVADRAKQKCTPAEARLISDCLTNADLSLKADAIVEKHCDLEAHVDDLTERIAYSVRDVIFKTLGVTVPPKPTSKTIRSAEAAAKKKGPAGKPSKKPAAKAKPAKGKAAKPGEGSIETPEDEDTD